MERCALDVLGCFVFTICTSTYLVPKQPYRVLPLCFLLNFILHCVEVHSGTEAALSQKISETSTLTFDVVPKCSWTWQFVMVAEQDVMKDLVMGSTRRRIGEVDQPQLVSNMQ